MAKPYSQAELQGLLEVIRDNPGGVALGYLAPAGASPAQKKAVQRRLKRLAEDGKIVARGSGKGTRYLPLNEPLKQPLEPAIDSKGELIVPLTPSGKDILRAVRQPIQKRAPVGYNRAFLESYEPNKTSYLTADERAHLHKIGQTDLPDQPAGTYAKQIMQRLLIDLAFHSSRLEGNTYSLLDTKRLLELGQAAQGKGDQDTQMILNHKDAIDFLVSDAEEIGFNKHTILNLHGLLSNNLLGNPAAVGRLRMIAVAIGGSVYKPLEVPAVIDEVFEQLLHTASVINDPFEQALFVLIQIPYLQAFEDVNKRVSRLAANIPFIKQNLRPLSFVDVPDDLYTYGMLGVYELNRIELLRDVFVWAYERSAQQYTAVRHTLGEPDVFRLRYREAMRTLVGEVIREKLGKLAAVDRVEAWAEANIPVPDRDQFEGVVETELSSLHEGNFVRYRVRPSEFATWKKAWDNEL